MAHKPSTVARLALAAALASVLIAQAQDASNPETLAEAEQLNTGMNAELYFYVTRPTNSFEEVVEVLPAHMDFIHSIEESGVMVMGGQTTAEGAADAGGYGLVVIRAASFEEAREIAERDPMHETGVRSFELFKWNVNEGMTVIRLKFSDQSFTLE
ncbi:MAG: YciI family protein [Pseudomonadota bacterium]